MDERQEQSLLNRITALHSAIQMQDSVNQASCVSIDSSIAEEQQILTGEPRGFGRLNRKDYIMQIKAAADNMANIAEGINKQKGK